MSETDTLFDRIYAQYNTMSKGNKRIADFVMGHLDQAAFMTAARIGEMASVSESTATRFALMLGYSGFPAFHRELEKLVGDKLQEKRIKKIDYDHVPESGVLEAVLQSDLDQLSQTMREVDEGSFLQAVEILLAAKDIYCLGIRSCAPLADLLSFYLKQIFPHVHKVTSNNASELFEQMLRIGEGDVLIGISFPRYSMRTLKAMEFANNRKASVIALTDSIHSPMNLYSSCNLIAKSSLTTVMDSMTAPVSMINALIVALGMKKKEEMMRTLEELEDVWAEYQVYQSDEMNYLDERMTFLHKNVEMDNE